MEKNKSKMIKELNLKRKETFPKAETFFQDNTAHVEVLKEDGQIEKTYFIIVPFCHALSSETKEIFNKLAARVSPLTKVNSLLKESEELVRRVKHEYRMNVIFNKFQLVATLTNNISLWRNLAFYNTVAINILIVSTYEMECETIDYVKGIRENCSPINCTISLISLPLMP